MYKAKNVDTDKALEHIRQTREYLKSDVDKQIAELRGYWRGIEKGIEVAKGIFECSNYEKTEKEKTEKEEDKNVW